MPRSLVGLAAAACLGSAPALSPAAVAAATAVCFERCTPDAIEAFSPLGADGIATTRHGYAFLATCSVPGRGEASVLVEAEYDPETGRGREEIRARIGASRPVALETRFACDGDPFRGSARCTETGRIGWRTLHGDEVRDHDLCPGAAPPLLRHPTGAADPLRAEDTFLLPRAGQQFPGDVPVEIRSAPGQAPVALQVEVFEAGHWRRLHDPRLLAAVHPGTATVLPRDLFGPVQRARVRAVLPDGTTGAPVEFGLSGAP